jgi:lipopolysaccharide export system permease protein
MNFLYTRLGRYLIARTLSGVLVVLGGVLISIMLIDLVEQMRTIGSRIDLPLLEALRLTLLKTPTLIEQTLPFVMLAGTMMAVLGLNRSSELVALRASGISAWRFLTPAAAIGIIAGLFVVFALNPFGSWLYQGYELEKARLTAEFQEGGAQNEAQHNGVWIRQGDERGQIVINAASVDPAEARLRDATFIFFETRQGALRFTRRIHAETAELRSGIWRLSNLVEAVPGGAPESQAHLDIPTTLSASELIDRFVAPATLSFWHLPGFIAEARQAGFAPTRYELKWQSLLSYPLMLAAMAGLGGAFSLRLHRLGQLAQWSAAGVSIGLGLFFFSQLAGAFAITQAVPPLIAAWSSPLAAGFIALAMLAFLEDG